LSSTRQAGIWEP